jgi:hypothetical protein
MTFNKQQLNYKEMKNDLTAFEKSLLKSINFFNNTNYNYKNLMEWDTVKERVEKNLKEGEIMYENLGVYVAIKPN